MSKDMTVRGVGGWLYFLIVMLTIIAPLAAIARLASEITTTEAQMPDLAFVPAWGNYKLALWGVTIAAAALGAVAGYRLAKFHVWQSVRFAILALWCSGPGAVIPIAVAAALIFGFAAVTQMVGELLGGTLQSAIAATIWTTYLLVSVRVRNTYPDLRLSSDNLAEPSTEPGPTA